jgi:hypothetical protein
MTVFHAAVQARLPAIGNIVHEIDGMERSEPRQAAALPTGLQSHPIQWRCQPDLPNDPGKPRSGASD